MTLSIVIAAGGTGGHLVPAMAIATAVRRADAGASITFIGTRRAVESDLLAAGGYRSYPTVARGFSRDIRGAIGPLSLVPATVQALRALRRERANVVVGMGGYPSLPAVAAARLAGIPSIIHEANAIPGLANEVAARMTSHIAVSFPQAEHSFGRRRPRLIGVPVRDAIARLDAGALRAEALANFDVDPNRRTVLVFGGSLGAARINHAAIELAGRWRERTDVQMVLSTGSAHAGEVAARIPHGALIVRVRPYIERMELAYAVADVVVSRAGASTVAELAVTGIPSILIPLPIARRGEQHANARALAETGGALLLDDAHATGERLDAMLGPLLDDEAARGAMSAAARAAGRPGAADEMASWILDLAKVGR